MPVTRLDFTNIIPWTVQNIMLEHMQRCGLSTTKSNEALIGIAREMRQWDYDVVTIKEADQS